MESVIVSSGRNTLFNKFDRWSIAFLLLALYLGSFTLSEYYLSFSVREADCNPKVILAFINVLLLAVTLIFATLWSVVTRLNKGFETAQYRFPLHLSLFCILYLVAKLLDVAIEYSIFAVGFSSAVYLLCWYFSRLLIDTTWLALEFECSTNISRRTALFLSVIIAVALAAIPTGFWAIYLSGFSNQPKRSRLTDENLKPPTFRLTAGISVEQFFGSLGEIEKELRKEVEEEK